MTTYIIDETQYPEICKLLEKSKVKKFNTPLEAFASEEARLRVNKLIEDENIPETDIQKCIDEVESELSNYLLYSENAFNYDGIDDIIKETVKIVLQK